MIYTLFATPNQAAWKNDVDDPVDGVVVGQMLNDVQQNILYYQIKNLVLNNTQSSTIDITGLTANWLFIIIKAIGLAHIATTGTDSLLASISGVQRIYGTRVFPGWGIISTQNLATMSLVSEQDGTEIQLFAGIACADNDFRLLTNA